MTHNDTIETAKLLCTINTGIIAVTIAFLKDLFQNQSGHKIIKRAWMFLLSSTISSVVAVNFYDNEDVAGASIFLSLSLNIVGTIFVMRFTIKAAEERNRVNVKLNAGVSPEVPDSGNKQNIV